MFRSHMLKKRFLIIFCIAIILPISLALVFMTAYFNNTLRQEQARLFTGTLYATGENVGQYLDELLRLTLAPLQYTEFMDAYEFINQGKLDNPQYAKESFYIQRTYGYAAFKLMYTFRKDILGITFYPSSDPDMAYHISRTGLTLEVSDELPASRQPWYQDVMRQNGKGVIIAQHVSPLHKDNPTVFSAARLISNIVIDKPVGIIKVDALDTVIKEIFIRVESGEQSILALLDQNGNIINANKPVDRNIFQNISVGVPFSYGKDTFTPTIESISQTGWKLVYLSSGNDIRAITNTIMSITAISALICIFGAYWIFKVNSQKIVDKVDSILHAMKRAEQGDLTARADPCGNDELADIASALNRTIEKLDEHIKSEYLAQLSRKNAEYLALQAQINPHFLYNTLSCFVGLNRMGEKTLLEKSIIQLTNLMRYTCQNSDTATVGEEISFLGNYLNLMQVRYDERLCFSTDVTPEAAGKTIPKLLLQPLVENSILHGFEPYDLHIRITICARIFDDALELTVSDTGKGFDVQTPSDRVGLKNVSQRLHLFHAKARFAVQSSPDEGTLCTIYIPLA